MLTNPQLTVLKKVWMRNGEWRQVLTPKILGVVSVPVKATYSDMPLVA